MAKRQVFFSFHYANPTLTAKREYYGIGEVMIAFGIKFSIDSGCRGDVLFEAKTPELARHYEKDFHARQVATLNSGGPQRYMLAGYKIDELADAAGGYFAMPSADELAYTELLFDVCDQFGIHYYSADKKARAFVEEVTRVTWAKQQEEKTGVQQSIRPAFTA